MNAIMKSSQNAEVTITLKEILEEMKPKLTCNFLLDFGLLEDRKKLIIDASSVDVYNTLERLAASQVQDNSLIRSSKKFKTYILKNLLTGHIKIGKTRHQDVMNRINQIKVGAEIKLMYVIPKDVENYLHKKYNNKLQKDEWFDLSEKDLESIKAEFELDEEVA